MIIPNNFAPAMLITLFAGLSTAIGGGIAFIVKKDNLKALSVGLGFSAGVMVFVSFMDMLPEAGKLLAQHFPNTHEWLTLAGFVAGLIVAILIDYFLPDHIDTEDVLHPDGPAHRNYRIKELEFLPQSQFVYTTFQKEWLHFLQQPRILHLDCLSA